MGGFMTKPVLYFDLEANGLGHAADTIWCICTRDLRTNEKRQFRPHQIQDGVDYLMSADKVAAHNGIAYDKQLIKKLYGVTLPRCVDTIVISRLLWPDRFQSPVGEHSLAEWGEFLKFPKVEHYDWSQFSEEMLHRCDVDVDLGTMVFNYQRKFFKDWQKSIALELDVAEIVAEQVWNGVVIDVKSASELNQKTTEATDYIIQEMQKLVPPRVEVLKTPEYYKIPGVKQEFPTKGQAQMYARSNKLGKVNITDGPLRKKIEPFRPSCVAWLAQHLIDKYKWKPALRSEKTDIPVLDKDVVEKLINSQGWPELELVQEFRITEKRRSDSQAWIDGISPETGRLHPEVITNGAVTGRMSHKNPNVNVPKLKFGPDKKILMGLEGKFGYECRRCFVPTPGWWMVGADASGLELRMLAHYMARYDGGEYVDILLNGDIHTYNQEAAGLASRDDAKTFIYALLYGAGDAKIGKIVKGTAKDGKRLRATFMARISAYAQLKDAVEQVVREKESVIGLDGRIVPIRSQHSALNTVLQGGGAVVMKFAAVIRDRWIKEEISNTDWRQLLNVHDEWQAEAKRKEQAERIGELSTAAITQAGLDLNLRCPLAGEFKVGKSWADCH